MSATQTPNLALTYLVPSQSQPEVPINDAFNKIDAAATAAGSIKVGSVSAVTQLNFTGGASVTAGAAGVANVAISGAVAAAGYPSLVIADGAVFFVPCNDPTDATPKDIVGGNIGTASGGTPTIDLAGPPTLGGGEVLITNAETISWPNPLQTTSYAGSFSVEAWIKVTDTSALGGALGSGWYAAGTILIADISGPENDWGLGLNAGGPSWGIGDPDTVVQSSSTLALDGAWHHIVGTYNASSGALKLYIDAALVATGTGGTGARPGAANCWFGKNSSGWGGAASCLAIYESELSQTQVTKHYTAGLAAVPLYGAMRVAALPASLAAGARAWVTDATATTFLSTVAGGGANKVPVVFDGAEWLIG